MTHTPIGTADAVVDAALNAMDAAQLRELVLTILPSLDEATQARLMNDIVHRAARESSELAPTTPSDARIVEIEAFAAAASDVGQADPSDVDASLQQGSHAFLARDYASAFRIFRALLIPIGNGDIDLGQHELVDEVLGVDIDACAKQYAVAMYMTSTPKNRARAVHSAMQDVRGIGLFYSPLQDIERVAVEPLPDADAFFQKWQTLVEGLVAAAAPRDWDRNEDRWLREVVSRTQGTDGLARIARSSRRRDDLRAWCRALADAEDWSAASAAYQEAADIVEARPSARGGFLDGAALAAQQLGSGDLDAALERAWRAAPSLTRLSRWLGECTSRAALVTRAGSALEAVPAEATCQRALLQVLSGELRAAAALLATAQGLGWSHGEHPGSLVFPLFVALFHGERVSVQLPRDPSDMSALVDDGRPRLRTPSVDALVQRAAVTLPNEEGVRRAMLAAMRAAAEKRVESVTANKRRRHYRHAASIAVQCARADRSPGAKRWLRDLKAGYRRYPALTRAFAAEEHV